MLHKVEAGQLFRSPFGMILRRGGRILHPAKRPPPLLFSPPRAPAAGRHSPCQDSLTPLMPHCRQPESQANIVVIKKRLQRVNKRSRCGCTSVRSMCAAQSVFCVSRGIDDRRGSWSNSVDGSFFGARRVASPQQSEGLSTPAMWSARLRSGGGHLNRFCLMRRRSQRAKGTGPGGCCLQHAAYAYHDTVAQQAQCDHACYS